MIGKWRLIFHNHQTNWGKSNRKLSKSLYHPQKHFSLRYAEIPPVYLVHPSSFAWIFIYWIQQKAFLIRRITRATHTNEDWRSPCKTVRDDELSRAGIHLNLHQICNHAKKSVTDSLLKLMSWLRGLRWPPQDRKAITLPWPFLSLSVTTAKWRMGPDVSTF